MEEKNQFPQTDFRQTDLPTGPGFDPQQLIKLCLVTHACNFSTWEIESEGSEVQGYHLLCDEFGSQLELSKAQKPSKNEGGNESLS